jgi:hypothetical protein
MADLVTNKLCYELAIGDANLDAADLRACLLKTTAPTVDTNFRSDVTELTVAGYAIQALAGESVTEDDTNDFAYLDATDPVFTGLAAGETAIGMGMHRHVTVASDSPFYAFYDTADTPTNGGNITGIFATPANGGALKIGR